ncbi:glycogen/starch/alpha-glucan phosphorylase [Gloeobacter violaceus]|uniref:Alpha-1,4 glucan phosphorylase n=1 Tax=Gloeobacter violaceus (strain ATCC 29082 / PCC 7421) TaxID=251221 RepID=Q7NMS8_GLOVI|nr:glycogen/starch/alpha-glucan phosphorylase [Gloeobacter violaceus]BAC88628.1 glycogen phosphorylase [Gloeobacter violaceus PCC 7421]
MQPPPPQTPPDMPLEEPSAAPGVEALRQAIVDNLRYVLGKDPSQAGAQDFLAALAHTVRDPLLHRWRNTRQAYFDCGARVVCYLASQYRPGPQLVANLVSAGLYARSVEALAGLGVRLEDLLALEREPQLGRREGSRQAASLAEALATQQMPAIGYGLRYEFGSEQVIRDGWPFERPVPWRFADDPWEIPRPEYRVEVPLGGRTEAHLDGENRYRVRWLPEGAVIGEPYDRLVPGYRTHTVNTLRLWSARASEQFDAPVANPEEYARAVEAKLDCELITRVPYPAGDGPHHQRLRLQQQYLLACCSVHDIVRLFTQTGRPLGELPERAAIHIDDSHPPIAIAEWMRILVDRHDLGWEEAWEMTGRMFSATAHTWAVETLECWPVALVERWLPRHLEILREIDRRFRLQLQALLVDEAQIARLSLFADDQVRLAHLACIACHTVVGTSESATGQLAQTVLADFHRLWPQKFQTIGAGVSTRRWLVLANPPLARLIGERIGPHWLTHPEGLDALRRHAADPDFQRSWRQIKQAHKRSLAAQLLATSGVALSSEALFDIRLEPFEGCRRQLLSALYIVTLFNRLQSEPGANIVPRAFIFSGWPRPGDPLGRLTVKLIHAVGAVVNADPIVAGRIRVVFVPEPTVALTQKIFAAADLAEQDALPGFQAGDTGSLCAALNGALLLGSPDGINLEIERTVGRERFFEFGLSTGEGQALKLTEYQPMAFYHSNPLLRQVVDQIATGYFSHGDSEQFKPIVAAMVEDDEALNLVDYQSYVDGQGSVDAAYRDLALWTRLSIESVSRLGAVCCDRTAREYCSRIWRLQPVKVHLDAYSQQVIALKGREHL